MLRTSYSGAIAAASLALAASASAQTVVYDNLTTYLNDSVVNLGAAPDGGGFKTLMIADDLTFAPGSAGLAIGGFSFTVRSFNNVNLTHRTLISIYADNGANGPGDLLYSNAFVGTTNANSIETATFAPGSLLFNVPASGKIWAGMAFDNRQGTLAVSQAQLDNFGQGAYGPPTVGSSSANVFVTNAVGNYVVNNPVGHLENTGFSLGWNFITRVPANVSWAVTTAGTWDPNIPNWTGGSPNADRYVNGDHATFNLTAGGTVFINSGIAPGSTTVSATSGTYTFVDQGIQTSTLMKTGGGRLVLNNANTFTGDTTVGNAGGTTAMGADAHLTLNSSSGNALAGDLHIGVASATGPNVAKVNLAQSNQIADDRVVHFDSPAGQWAYLSIRGNSETVAGVVSTNTGGVIENGNFNGAINTDGTLTVAAPVGVTHSFTGIIRDADVNGGTGKLNIVVNGPGTQVLGAGGAYTYTGTTTVNGGTLRVDGTLGATHVTVNSGGTLAGNGGASGNVAIAGGTLAPGASIGSFDVGDITFTAASSLSAEIDLDATPDADLLSVTGGITLGGASLELDLENATTSSLPKTFLIMSNDGADTVAGTFGSITGLPAEYDVTVNYAFSGTDALGRIGSGNDVAITIAVPEPTALGLLASASALVLRRRRR